MTGNQVHNLSLAVEGFTEKHTNLTHYQDITTLILTNNSMNYFSHACLPPRCTLFLTNVISYKKLTLLLLSVKVALPRRFFKKLMRKSVCSAWPP